MSDYDTLFPSPGEDIYDLGVGAPSKEDLLSVSKNVFAPSVAAARLDGSLDDGREGTFQYGPARGPRGYLRRLSEFLQDGYASQMAPVRQECLLATAGATSGLWLCATDLLRRDAVVFVESPTYFVALQVLRRDLGHRVVPVPMGEDGMDLDALTILIEREKKISSINEGDADSKRFWAMLYTIPTFHNPTGVVLSPEKSRKLVQMAKQSDFLVLCDDVYNLLNYDGKSPPERLLAYDLLQNGEDDLGHVVSNGSFSKLVGPGWRLGWLEASAAMIRRLGDRSGILRSGGCMNQLSASLVAAGLEEGAVGRHVDSLKTAYGDRMQAVYQVLCCGLLGIK